MSRYCVVLICFVRLRRPPRAQRTDTLFPYRTSSDLPSKSCDASRLSCAMAGAAKMEAAETARRAANFIVITPLFADLAVAHPTRRRRPKFLEIGRAHV